MSLVKISRYANDAGQFISHPYFHWIHKLEKSFLVLMIYLQ